MIQSIQRVAKILNLFSLNNPLLGITEISRKLSLNKGTIQGLVQTMHHEGFLDKDEEMRKYKIGHKIYEFGLLWTESLAINNIAADSAHRLAKETEKLVRLAILDGDSALVTLDVAPRILPLFSRQFGLRLPLYCTAVGKVLLAFSRKEEIKSYVKKAKLIQYTNNTITRKKDLLTELEIIREKGYSLNRVESILGRAAIAAPVLNQEGVPIAAISLIMSSREISNAEEENILSKKVIQTAFEISQQLTRLPESRSGLLL